MLLLVLETGHEGDTSQLNRPDRTMVDWSPHRLPKYRYVLEERKHAIRTIFDKIQKFPCLAFAPTQINSSGYLN